MTDTLIAGVELGQSSYRYRVERHRITDDHPHQYKIFKRHWVIECFDFKEMIHEIFFSLNESLDADEYAALWELEDK